MFYNEEAEYKTLLPPIFQEIVEINVLDRTIRIQLDKLNTFIKESVDNKSIANASEKGVARWEKILGVSSPMNASLQARKHALKSKLISKPPINLQTLKRIVETYMGLTADVNVSNYVISIKYRGTSKIADLVPLYETMYKLIPANLVFDIAYLYLIWDELDEQNLTWDELDSENLNWNVFERGEWIV